MKHRVILAGDVHVKSYANLVLLQKVYSNLEQRQWVKRRKQFLKEELTKHGKLVCHYCGKDDLKLKSTKRAEQATVDHIVPKSKGGDPFDENNFVVCCNSCNQRKGSGQAEEFKQSKYVCRKRSAGR